MGRIEPDSIYTEQQKKVVEEGFRKIAHPKVTEALVNALRQKLDSSNYKNIAEILTEFGEYTLDSLLKLLTQEEAPKKDSFDLYVMRHSVAAILKKIGQPAKDALKQMPSSNIAILRSSSPSLSSVQWHSFLGSVKYPHGQP